MHLLDRDRDSRRFVDGRVVLGSLFEKQIPAEIGDHPEPIQLSRACQGFDRIDRFLFRRHSSEQATEAIREYLERRDISPQQQASIRRFHLITTALLHSPFQKLEEESVMTNYYDIFNTIFFYGSLKDYVKVDFNLNGLLEPGLLGLCSVPEDELPDPIPDNYAAWIQIVSLSEQEDYPSKYTRLMAYLGTLLHEMLHAYFSVCVCTCSPACLSSLNLSYGRSGHGPLWQQAALHIELATPRLLGVGLDIGRVEGAGSEWGPDWRELAPPTLLATMPPPKLPWEDLLDNSNQECIQVEDNQGRESMIL